MRELPLALVQLDPAPALQAGLRRANRVLPSLAEMPAIYHSVHGVVAQLRMYLANTLVNVSRPHWPLSQNEQNRSGKGRVHASPAKRAPDHVVFDALPLAAKSQGKQGVDGLPPRESPSPQFPGNAGDPLQHRGTHDGAKVCVSTEVGQHPRYMPAMLDGNAILHIPVASSFDVSCSLSTGGRGLAGLRRACSLGLRGF